MAPFSFHCWFMLVFVLGFIVYIFKLIVFIQVILYHLPCNTETCDTTGILPFVPFVQYL